MEIFRGKDFYSHFRAHPEEMDAVLGPAGDLSTEERIKKLGELYMRKGYFVKSERFFPRPHPGRTKLVKWPIRVIQADDQDFLEHSWFTWLHQRPPTPWVTIASWLLVAFVIGC